MLLGMKVGLGPSDFALRWGHSAPPQKKGHSPQFSAMAGWIKMPLGTKVGVGPGDFVLDGDPALRYLPQEGTAPTQFLTHVYCGHAVVAHLSYC